MVDGAVISQDPEAETEILIDARVDEAELNSCPNLRTVIIPFAGVPQAVLDIIRRHPHLSLHNLHHNAGDTAETAVALLLAAAKSIVPFDQSLRRNDWSPRYQPERSVSLGGKTAVILGYGEVGRRVGAILRAMKMSVVGIRRSSSEEADVYCVEKLREVLPNADVLIVALPHTPETTGLIGSAEIDLLPRTAVIVNIARGAIIDEQALYEALRRKRIHAAASDVWYQYPKEEGSAVPTHSSAPASATNQPPSQFPFGELDNIVMSPHRAGANQSTELHRIEALAVLLRQALEGRPMANRVDLDRGY